MIDKHVITTFRQNYNRWKLKSKGDENNGRIKVKILHSATNKEIINDDIEQLEMLKVNLNSWDKAYEIASELPHETRGRQIFVFAEDYDNYYQQKRKKALEESNFVKKQSSNIYQIRKFN